MHASVSETWALVDRAARVHAPALLRAAGLSVAPGLLEAAAPVRDLASAAAALELLRDAEAFAFTGPLVAALGYARDAVGDLLLDDLRSARRLALRVAVLAGEPVANIALPEPRCGCGGRLRAYDAGTCTDCVQAELEQSARLYEAPRAAVGQ